MPSAMARVADVVEQHPSAPLELTITELAEQARTSAATVTRFCRLIGFDGYTQFRVRVASEIGRASAESEDPPTPRPRRDLAPDDPPEVLRQTLLETLVRALENTAQALDLEAIESAATEVIGAEHLDIYGVGDSGIMANALQSRLYRIGINAHSWTAVHDGLASAALSGRGSVAIGISNTGHTADTVHMLAEAAAAGAFTIALTHDARSPIAKVADVTLATAAYVPGLRPDDLSVKHSQMFVIDLLYLLVAQHDFEAATARLSATSRAVAARRRPRRHGTPRPYRGIQEIR